MFCCQEAYKQTFLTADWHKRHEFPGGDSIVVHSPAVISHYVDSSQPDEWGATSVSGFDTRY